MSRKEDQIKMIEDLFEAGSITAQEKVEMLAVLEQEQDKKNGNSTVPSGTNEGNNRKRIPLLVFTILGAILLVIGFKMGWFSPRSNKEELADYVHEKCACDSITNNEIIQRYNQLINDVSEGKFQFRSLAEEERLKLENKINSERISAESMKCKKQLQVLEKKFQQDYPITSKKGREFWNELEQKMVAKEDFDAETKIDQLRDEFEKAKASIPFETAVELLQKKEQLKSHLNSFFGVYGTSYFDAYNWFASEIDQYILLKNVNPEYINKYFNNQEGDYQNQTFQWHPETLTISTTNGKDFTCVCMVDLSVWRPSKSQYQHSLVTYEMVINENNLISSIIEKKEENTRYDSSQH
jgi:hypothetical protein